MAGSSFSTKLGLVMAAAGSAVGLGNIWKFPYIAGENGGAAFLVVYLICVLLLGLPLVMTEFLIGKHSGRSAYGAFKELKGTNRWQWLSWMCMLTAMLFIGFYFVVTGWCFNYLFEALTNVLHGAEMDSLSTHFTQVISNKPRMILFSLFPVLLTATVLWFGVNKGIEKLSKVLMPLLLVMMVLMAVRVLMLKDSAIGMQFFFQADFSKLNPQAVMKAMGQCFFSLSIGMGALITYGAYMPKNQSVSKTSMQVVILDTLVAILAGMIIFPAVFAFGMDPAEGPELVFVILPAIFEQMSFSYIFGVLFFSLLCIAAITSTISIMEVSVAFVNEATGGRLNRHKSVLLVSAAVIPLVLACVFSNSVFDVFDTLTSCVLMPLGALGMAIFVGWNLPNYNHFAGKVFIFSVRWIVPIAILVIFLNSVGIIQ